MLGLQACGHIDLMESMVDNFTHLILQVGFIPNGNRTYYLGRSQPPYYALMVQLLAGIKGEQVLEKYLPALLAEYEFWMKGVAELQQAGDAKWHVAMMPDGSVLNRYCDLFETPRPESYREDIELAHQSFQTKERLYKNLRAGAESGWDFSSRWFAAGGGFETIETAEVVPVDLNCLIWHLEITIARAYRVTNDVSNCENYTGLAMKRALAISKYCWNEVETYFTDVNCNNASQRDAITLAGVMPLFSGIATTIQAAAVAAKLEASFLHAGGLITTLNFTNQQWDAPNGWAPLQWIAVSGLKNYGYKELADRIATRWMRLNEEVFARTGKFMEKYNVVDTALEAGGGEYEGQDGFGWTNGVYMAMKVQHANS
jgi:alpha,alpha-trehalase